MQTYITKSNKFKNISKSYKLIKEYMNPKEVKVLNYSENNHSKRFFFKKKNAYKKISCTRFYCNWKGDL